VDADNDPATKCTAVSSAFKAAKSNTITYVIAGALGGVVLVVILVIVLLVRRHRRLQAEKNRPLSFDEQFEALRAHGLIVDHGSMQIRELARRHVKVLETLGEGQFGIVCKGLVNEMAVNGVPEYPAAIKVKQVTP
jgi:flagellar biosynthesis/type III secretory pathway M-ring protein FliF/YscJ